MKHHACRLKGQDADFWSIGLASWAQAPKGSSLSKLRPPETSQLHVFDQPRTFHSYSQGNKPLNTFISSSASSPSALIITDIVLPAQLSKKGLHAFSPHGRHEAKDPDEGHVLEHVSHFHQPGM